MTTQDSVDTVPLEVGIEVYIADPKKGHGHKPCIYIVKSIDNLGNAKLVANHNPRAHRNFPNVDILVGKLIRSDGRVVRGQVNERKPLPPVSRGIPVKYIGRTQ